MKTRIAFAYFIALAVLLVAFASDEPRLQAQAALPPAQPAAVSLHDSTNELYVTVGKTVLVDCAKPIARVAVGLGEVAEAQPTSPTEIMVNGKAPGETSLIIWDIHGGRQFFNVTVRASSSLSNNNLDAVRRELKTELPGENLKVSAENGTVFLRGEVKNFTSSQRAVLIASTAGKVVNLLNVEVPAAEQQILLKVRFASIDLSKLRELGINLTLTKLGNSTTTSSTGQYSSGYQLSSTYTLGGSSVEADIKALDTNAVTETLAEPNILAVNGKQASFLAGGEYPYPTAQGSSSSSSSTNSITITYKEYGIRLNFLPIITPRGTIRLQVAPEVSALDYSNEVSIGGVDVPAITTRKIQTEVELADGQSFVIGGLLDNTDISTFEKIPFLGDIPILGKLFQSESKKKQNTELIVIVTPEIVAPIQAGTPLPDLKFPEKFLPPNSDIPMHTPDAKTAANTPASPPPTIPIEKLIESMKPEPALQVGGGGVAFGSGAGSTSSSSAGSSSPSSSSPQ